MLKPWFDWFQTFAFSDAFRQSVWMFAFTQDIHLVALAVFVGAVLIVDLRLLGAGLRERPVTQVARDAQPWLVGAFFVLLLTGVPMILGNGEKYYYSDIFWQKMALLSIALVYTLTIHRRIVRAPEPSNRYLWRRTAAGLSIALWLFVAVWGRLIGLLT